MKPKLVIPTLVATVACALGAVPAASAATDVQQASSENWSGYVVGGSSSGSSGTQFKSVSGSWVAPTAKCTSGSGYSAFWVGLGGAGQTEALEQDGTEADCSANGTASYFAWYELVPSAPVKVNMAVHPGDHITSKVTVDATNVTVDLSDLDKSTLDLVIGQSGDPLSPNYIDQWPYWYAGKTFALPFSDAAVQATATHTSTLVP